MKKKILTIIIVLFILVYFSINVFSENEIANNEISTNIVNSEAVNEEANMTLEEKKQDVENKLTESNNRLEYVESELTTSLQKIQELDDQITEYETQYNDLKSQVETLEKQISETEENIQTIENAYNRKDEILRKRIVALYEAGDSTYLDVLLDSTSLIDFLSRYFIIQQILEVDNEALDDLAKQKQEVEKQKEEQESRKTELRVAKAKAGQMQILMENNKILQENYISQLTEEEQQLQTQIEEYKKEQEEIEKQIQEAILWGQNLAIQYTGGVMAWPIAKAGTYITSGYGIRLHPIQGVYKYHSGIDIGNAGYGAPVIAAADGVVTFAGQMSGYGNCVMVNHGSGIVTLYGHGQEIKTELGKEVKKGDLIMLVGSTGNSTGPHLHFEVRVNGTATNPIPFLKGEENTTSTNTESTGNTVNTENTISNETANVITNTN